MATPPSTPDGLDPSAVARFVHGWGSLAHAWGIPRSMGEIHALLFISAEPMCTDDIMDRLHLSRGGANTNLRALEEWRLVRRLHKPGDRKDYFAAEGDSWTVLWTLVAERKRREVDPLLAVLRECVDQAPGGNGAHNALYRERLTELLGLFEDIDRLYELLRGMEREGAQELLRLFETAG